ncbi:hypothetical protein NC661_15430 [Aquibacillus koreensis]|uniref:Uncharacterized protein n=1 Tax=Aquibacillus koreensis TaxID=279446 RepID=A0A9X4AJG3_9BACI|nr:hypothetical protein [Aquibacillus koreensis]MCT2534457.1 hypothetical protein [Aquibacillus koreensis]MDC3421764.1 hypothetical protein [Aquibacillus koreensis]
MYKKTCNHCFQLSFSSQKNGLWNCPVCGMNITTLRAYDAESTYKRNPNSLLQLYTLEGKEQTKTNVSTYI